MPLIQLVLGCRAHGFQPLLKLSAIGDLVQRAAWFQACGRYHRDLYCLVRIYWGSQGGDFQESCHSWAATQAA